MNSSVKQEHYIYPLGDVLWVMEKQLLKGGLEHSTCLADVSFLLSSPTPIMLSATGSGTLPVLLWIWPLMPGVREESEGGGHGAKIKATDGHV